MYVTENNIYLIYYCYLHLHLLLQHVFQPTLVMNNNLGIKELARLAEVSIGTVDRVLHNREGVSSATKEKVLKIVEETGYKKNILASRLKLASIKTIKIAILVPEVSSKMNYWNLPLEGVTSAVEELKDVGVTTDILYFDLLNPESFSNKYDEILSEEYDGLVTVPFFERESNILLEQAAAKNIPVVFIDTERELNLTANFINQNSFNAGKVAGRMLHGMLGNDACYVVVNILNQRGKQINNLQREDGFRAFFAENTPEATADIRVINHPLESNVELTDEMKEVLNEKNGFGIFVTNARAFLIPELLEKFKIKNTRIIGFDLNPRNVSYLKSGEIDFLINQKPEYQGHSAVKGLYKYLTEKDKSLLNLQIPVEIVVKENVDYYIK